MKKYALLLALILVFGLWIADKSNSTAAENEAFQTQEYVTIRWAGRENTHLIRANGRVEFLGSILSKVTRPNRVDERAFYMNIAMNSVAKEGYEFVGMTYDEIIMKRAVPR